MSLVHLTLTTPGHIKVIIGSTEYLAADKVGSRTTVPIWMTVPDGPLREFERKRMIIVKERVAYVEELEDGSAAAMDMMKSPKLAHKPKHAPVLQPQI